VQNQKNMKTKQRSIFLTFAAVLLTVSSQAQTVRNWTSTADGDFFTPGNWEGGVVPAATDTAVINNGTTATMAGTGTNDLGRIILGALNEGADQGTTESGHIIMNSGFLRLGGTSGDGKAVIGLSETLSTFIMNGGTIWFDGPELFPGSTGDDGLTGLDWEVGERGLGRFEMHSNAVFRAGDDLKIAENAAGNGSCLIDGNAKLSLGSGISISGGGTNVQTMVIGGNAVVDSGNSMGAGDPLGSTDEGYLTMSTGEGVAHLTIQDNGILNIRRLTARQGTSTILVKNNGQFHIFDVLRGKGNTVNPPDRPAETGPGADNNNSTYPSQPGTSTITLQDDAQMTVNAATAGHLTGLAISGPRADSDPGGTGILVVRDRALFRVEQDLGLGVGRDGDDSDGLVSDGTLEIVGPNAQVSIGTNLNMAVNSDGTVAARDLDGNPAAIPGKATLSAVITGSTHSTVNVGGTAYIAHGILKVALQGYAPVGGETYTLIQGGVIDGQFRETNYTAAPLAAGLSWTLEYATNAVRLKVAGQTAAPRIVTVTTTNNVAPPTGTVSLLQALTDLQDGDIIRFNIPGAGPHFIETPTDGYPLITNDNVTIDGYSQPGAVPNTNPILSSNNAQIKIVLDSRNGNSRLMDFPPSAPGDQTGYGDTESAVIGILEATNVTIRGVSILAVPLTGPAADVALYGISFAKGAAGHVDGCWIGVAPDGATIAGPADGITGFRYRIRDEADTAFIDQILIQNVTIGVWRNSTNARSEFNVITGIPGIPIILEGSNLKISGNFINVWPGGLLDYNPPRDFPNLPEEAFGGNIEIGRGDNNVVIGVDGDGVNDADERNILSGVLPPSMNGYDHNIEFYGQTPGTNIIIAGNYIGVGVDGVTYFTNGVPAVNAGGGSAQYRIGSDFNGVSDALEGNLIVNNYPSSLFPASGFTDIPGDLNFFDELNAGGTVSLRGNTLINNFPAPVSPLRENTLLFDYMSKAIADTNNGVVPVLATNTSATLLAGTVPVASTNFPVTVIDLYIADPVGITNGQAANIPGLTNGFVQGRVYLGSFVEGSPADLNTNAGAFEFSISSLGITNGTTITVTANYLQGPAGATNGVALTSPFSDPVTVAGAGVQPSVSISRTGGQISVTFTGTLESAPAVTGPWTPVAGSPSSPYPVPPADLTETRFYRSTGP
jgi:hypothetical protein